MENKDFTDYFLLFLNTGREHEFFKAFNKLVEDAENFVPEDTENILHKDHDKYKNVDFYDAINEKYIDKPISFSAIIRGEASKPYIYPVKIKLHCDLTRGEKCATCGMFLTGGNIQLNLENINPLELIDINNDAKLRFIKKKTGITQCAQFEIEVVDQRYMQELFLSPKVTNTGDVKEQRFIVRHAFSEGSDLIPNKTYRFSGIPTTSPKNQSLVYYIKKAEREESDLDNFNLSKQDINDLKIFQCDKNAIKEKLKDIYDDLSVNISPVIRFRNDIMFAIDLGFHSVLDFWFGNSLEKGWIESLIVGDTAVGKTKIATKLINHYGLGVIQGAENSTVAGLIGGMTKFESINIMTWGLLPLNNSRLVILDEMSGIDRKVFGELTRIRGEGIAERTLVGGSSSTPSKVRLIWLSNPRKRSMRLYDSGCDMARELIGSDEDISRFDFILTVSGDEVKTEEINNLRSAGKKYVTKHIYRAELCNKLVLWAWSRKPHQIEFDEDVEFLILHNAVEMSKRYTETFPLVQGSTIRLKISRLAIALAARLFSTKNGEAIFVTQHHVQFVCDWLNKIYNKPSFGYGEYSDYFNQGEEQSVDATGEVLNEMDTMKDKKTFIINMLTNPRITAIEIRDFTGFGRETADDFRQKLVAGGFLIKKAGFYVKSDLFRRILKKELKGL